MELIFLLLVLVLILGIGLLVFLISVAIQVDKRFPTHFKDTIFLDGNKLVCECGSKDHERLGTWSDKENILKASYHHCFKCDEVWTVNV